MKFLYLTAVLLNLIFLHQTYSDGENSEDYNEQLYKELFKRRRADQLKAIKGFKKFNYYDKQSSMIVILAKKIFNVIESSRALLEASDYVPGHSPFPKDEKIGDALSNILENTALFGEIILRFPEISEKVLRDNNEWSVMYQWSIGFCHLSSSLLDKSTLTLLNLISQELNFIPRDAKYRNPYRKQVPTPKPVEEFTETVKKKKKRKEIKKGPRLTSGHIEL